MRIVIILLILAVVGIVMVWLARRRKITELSTQETRESPPVRDRPAGPEAETMDPDQTGGHPSAN